MGSVVVWNGGSNGGDGGTGDVGEGWESHYHCSQNTVTFMNCNSKATDDIETEKCAL